MYAYKFYVKNVPVQVKLCSYRTVQQLFTSNAKIDNTVSQIGTMMPTVWIIKIFFNQNKKMIAINDRKNVGN